MSGFIFDIQRFSVHDGPGIRTTVFFKGCNLHCFWCHNPESISPRREVQLLEAKCIGCGRCAAVCPNGCHAFADEGRVYLRDRCRCCGNCAEGCPPGALSLVGKSWDAKDVLDIVVRDAPFYKNSGGGITCSGGEPLLQAGFLEELLRGAKSAGLHTAVDTAGNVPFSQFERVLPFTDLFLYDLKCMDTAAHLLATGSGNELILANLEGLSRAGAQLWVRIPVIDGVNATPGNMERSADFLSGLAGVRLVELLTYHRLGGGKYESFGKTWEARDLVPATKEEMQELSKPFADKSLPVKIS